MANEQLISDLARQLIAAEEHGTPIGPFESYHAALSEEDAYAIQGAIVDSKVRHGDRVTGMKCGATNQGAQRLFGLSEPFYGCILYSGQITHGSSIVVSRLHQPRIECEIAFRLKHDLAGPDVTRADVVAATDAVIAAFEVVDTRIRDWKVLGKYEVIADSGLTARYVLGEQRLDVATLNFEHIPVVLLRNGEKMVEGTSQAVLGDPLLSVAWLANKLATHQRQLTAGEIVLAGSLTPLQPVGVGDQMEARFEGIGKVAIQFV